MLVCSLYAVAVQSKTHKGAFAIIFFISRDLLNCLWNTCTYYIIIILDIKESITILTASKSTCTCCFEKCWCRVPPATTRNLKLILKFSYMRPVFPEYSSVFYDYGFKQLAFGWQTAKQFSCYTSWLVWWPLRSKDIDYIFYFTKHFVTP